MQTLFDIVLKCNFVFVLSIHVYQQIQEMKIGTKMVPSYTNIFMDSLERWFLESEPLQPALWKCVMMTSSVYGQIRGSL